MTQFEHYLRCNQTETSSFSTFRPQETSRITSNRPGTLITLPHNSTTQFLRLHSLESILKSNHSAIQPSFRQNQQSKYCSPWTDQIPGTQFIPLSRNGRKVLFTTLCNHASRLRTAGEKRPTQTSPEFRPEITPKKATFSPHYSPPLNPTSKTPACTNPEEEKHR